MGLTFPTRTTGWSPAGWKPSGTPRCNERPTPRPSWPGEDVAPTSSATKRRPDPGARRRPRPGVVGTATTTDKDRKQLLHTLLEEVNISVRRDHSEPRAELVLRWNGGALTDLDRAAAPKPTQDLQRGHHRAAPPARRHYPDAQIAGILNDNTAAPPGDCRSPPVGSSRCDTPGRSPATSPPRPAREGRRAAHRDRRRSQTRHRPSTLLRWLGDGFVAGEQVTPGAPWRIRLTEQLRGLLVDDTPDGWVAVRVSHPRPGVSRQTVLQQVKRGELQAVLTRTGRRKGLRIHIPTPKRACFEQ